MEGYEKKTACIKHLNLPLKTGMHCLGTGNDRQFYQFFSSMLLVHVPAHAYCPFAEGKEGAIHVQVFMSLLNCGTFLLTSKHCCSLLL